MNLAHDLCQTFGSHLFPDIFWGLIPRYIKGDFITHDRLNLKLLPPVVVVLELFEEKGFSTTVNRPYSGSLVPLEYYRKEKNIYSIMIEVNRRLYMNEQSGEKSEHFEEISIELTEILEKLKSISLRQNIKLHEKR